MSVFREFGDLHINLELVCYVYFNERSADVHFTNGSEVTLYGKDAIDLKNILFSPLTIGG